MSTPSTLMPTRLLILQRLAALIEGTTTELPLPPVDLTGKVFRGRALTGQEVGRPAVSILESPRPENAFWAGHWDTQRSFWTILIQGMTEDDKENPSDAAYYLAAAVERQLFKVIAMNERVGRPLYPEHYLLGELITSIEIAPAVVRPPEKDTSSTAFFFLPLRLGVAASPGEPYTAP